MIINLDMYKKTSLVFLLSTIFIFSLYAQKPKYIFYLIGDGMGLNHVHLTEAYQAELNKQIGVSPLLFSQFPYVSFATTNSQSNGVTDSSAGGTALAVGKKTKNGIVAMDSSATVPYKSIAYAAKEKGMKVGITTSVSIDHATPASFYANQASRSMYYEIANDIIKSNFDFFGGAGFLRPTTTADKKEAPEITGLLEKAGYRIVSGRKEFEKEKNKNKKIILINNDQSVPNALKFAIDQGEDDFKLQDITQSAIESLDNSENGFFLMVEGGKIDWSAHANDAATTIHEVLDFNKSVQLAYDFYLKHPEETLIVVTADHETGGLVVGNRGSTLRLSNLAHQKVSQDQLSRLVRKERVDNPNATWEDIKTLLSDNLGLWSQIKVDKNDEKVLKEAYTKSFINHENETAKSLYANDDKIAAIAVDILNKLSTVGWGTGGHTAAYVPIYAIGAGAEEFNKKMDNTDIPKTIAEVAGLNL